jgi:PAS domain S-box-containing protein
VGGILIDITSRKQAEAERGEALARVSTVLRAAPIGLAFYDQALRFAHVNQALADILGITVESALGKTQWEAIPQFAPLFVPLIQRVLATGDPVRNQEVQLEVHGGRRALLVSAYPVLPEHPGETPIEGVGAVVLDITSEKETRGRLEEAIRTRDEFLATLSHELRTPLTAILGYASMLRTGALPKDQVGRAAEVIERNARSQARLVEDLLDANRIVTGRMRLDLQLTPLEPLIREVVDSLRPAALAKSLSIRVRCEPVSPLLADADRLRQVVWNLVSNSIKFTPEHGRVNVKLSGAQGQVRLVVEDTGVGIPESFLSHVFERFRQADAGTTRAHGGLGLGLAIVKNLVELHGGSATAESEGPGKGTRVTVILPFLAPTSPSLAEDAESPTGDPSEP